IYIYIYIYITDLSVPSFNNSSSCLSILGEGKFSPFKDWKCDIENQERKTTNKFYKEIPRIRYIYNKIVFLLDKKVLPPKFTHDDTSVNKERGTVISFFSHRVMNEAFLKNVRKIKILNGTDIIKHDLVTST
ncbi:hypothetical protein Avbf_07467, partial [Armadillidium vulgare]